MPKDWEAIRAAREDLTDYVVHFTKHEYVRPDFHRAKDRLISILRCGYIKPSFAPLPSRHSSVPKPTIQGPDPAVCLTEQPLSAFLKTPQSRYKHYGIAFHKVALYNAGGRPVLYASKEELAALPESLKYLWVRYAPVYPGDDEYPVDFTWEREWRYKGDPLGLKVLLSTDWMRPPKEAIIVEKDNDVEEFSQVLVDLAQSGIDWPNHLKRIISLETAKRQINAGDSRYCRIETWPDETEAETAAAEPSG